MSGQLLLFHVLDSLLGQFIRAHPEVTGPTLVASFVNWVVVTLKQEPAEFYRRRLAELEAKPR